jgi:hypothetical protein
MKEPVMVFAVVQSSQETETRVFGVYSSLARALLAVAEDSDPGPEDMDWRMEWEGKLLRAYSESSLGYSYEIYEEFLNNEAPNPYFDAVSGTRMPAMGVIIKDA